MGRENFVYPVLTGLGLGGMQSRAGIPPASQVTPRVRAIFRRGRASPSHHLPTIYPCPPLESEKTWTPASGGILLLRHPNSPSHEIICLFFSIMLKRRHPAIQTPHALVRLAATARATLRVAPWH
jgi:hypothetical protein